MDSPTIVTLLSLIFAVLTGIGGVLIRILFGWTRTQDRITGLAEDMSQMAEQMREDRRATNDRLTWLERNAWPTARGRRS